MPHLALVRALYLDSSHVAVKIIPAHSRVRLYQVRIWEMECKDGFVQSIYC
jgi:hypothetical protein